jgi:hypothetical protein
MSMIPEPSDQAQPTAACTAVSFPGSGGVGRALNLLQFEKSGTMYQPLSRPKMGNPHVEQRDRSPMSAWVRQGEQGPSETSP